MKKVIFTNIAWPGNAGDYNSAPGMYYTFPNVEIHHIHFLDFYGAMTKNPDFEEYNVKNKIIVIFKYKNKKLYIQIISKNKV